MLPRHARPLRPLSVSLARMSSSLAIAATMALAVSARATVLDWDPAGNQSNSGGPGAWDLTSSFWHNGAAVADQVWVNANLDTAQFGGTGGIVTLSTGISAGGLNFNVDGMTVTGNTLTLGGATAVNVTAGATATISSTLAGNSGALVTGSGTLVLTQANSISGLIDIQAGTVRATNLGALGSGLVQVDSGATLEFNAGGGNLTNAIILNGGTLRQVPQADLFTQALITVNAASTIEMTSGVNYGKIFVNAGITGTGNLTKNGNNGILQIVQANLGYSGNWTLNGGFIEVQNTNALGTGTVTVNGGELVASNNVIPNAVIIGTSAAILGFNNGNAGAYQGTINAAQDFNVGLRDFYNLGQARNGKISGVISGTGAMNILNPTAPAQLLLTGNNAAWSGAITVPSNVQVRAVVGATGNALGTGAKTVNGSLVVITTPTLVAGPNAGFSARYYNSALLGTGVIGGFDFGLNTPAAVRNEATIDLVNGTGTIPNPPIPGFNRDNNGELWTGILNITTGGAYTFFTSSDDGSLLYLDGEQLVQNDFPQGVTERSGSTVLTAGLHSVIVKFGQGTGGGGMHAHYLGADTGNSHELIGSIAGTVTNTGLQILGTSTISTPIAPTGSGTLGFDLAAVNTTVTGAVTLGNNMGMTITGVTGSETLTLAGLVTLNGAHTLTLGINQIVNGVQNASSGADLVISGNIGESAAGSSLTKTGPRTLTLSGTNTFTGPTTVINGVLQLNSPVLNSAVGPGGLVINPTAGSVVVRLLTNEQMPDAATLAVSSVGSNTALFDLNGFTETLGGLTVTGTAANVTGVTTGAAGTLIANGGLTFNNNRAAIDNTGREAMITGTGSYAVAAPGVGTLSLGGAVRNVTVETTNVSPNIPGSDATIDVNIINGGIVKLGSRTLILNGTNSTFAGGTVITAGIVRGVGANGATSTVFGTGSITMNGGSLELRNNGTGSNGIITYGNNLVIDPSQTVVNFDVNNNGANTGNALSLGAVVIGSQTFNVTGGNNYSVRFNSATLTGNPIINPTTANLTLNNVGESGGSRSLTKPAGSTGILILTGSGTYSGGTNVAAGSGPLRLVPAIGTANKPAGTGPISLATGAILQITPVISSLTGAGAVAGSLSAKYYNGATTIATGNYAAIPTASTTVALLADGTFFNRPAVVANASANASGKNLLAVYSGLLNITNTGSYSFQTAVQEASQLVIDGVSVISVNTGGGTPQSLTDSATSLPITLNAGFHTIVMKAFNGATAGGGFRVRYQGLDTGGALQVISPTKLFNAPALLNVGNTGAPISLAAAASITIDGVGSDLDSSISTLTLGTGSTLNVTNSGGAGVIAVAGTTTLGGAATLNPTSALLNLVGDLADGGGNFAVTKTGPGALVLTGAKTFGGTLTINGGGVQVTNAASLGAVGGGTIVNSGGTLDLNGVALGAEPLTLNGVGTGSTGPTAAALYNSSAAAASASGTILLSSTTAVGGFGDLTLSGIISGATGKNLTKIGVDTLTLNGVNTFSGTFTIAQGIVKLGDNSALGATTVGTAITTVASGATLDLNGKTIAEPLVLAGAGLLNIGSANTLGALINTSGTAATVSGTVALGTSSSIGSSSLIGGGDITIGGVMSGTKFNKVGGNMVTLTKVNTYTGAGTVQLGTLILSGTGTVATESSMSVSPTATLTLDDTGTNNTSGSRLGSKTLLMIGGNLNIRGNAGASANTLEDLGIGQFQIDSYNSVVTLTPGGSNNVQFKAASLGRTGTFSTNGTALFRGTGLGAAAIGAGGAGGTASVAFTAAPTVTGQSGAAGSPNRGILPWALVDTATGGTGTSFATYSAANGLQALQAGDSTAGLTANNNVVATSALTAPAAGLTINSLTLKAGSGLTIGAGNNITLDSGGLLATATAGISGAGVLKTATTREIIIHTAGSSTILTIGTSIATAGGLTKAGDGTLRLTAQNTVTGALRLNGGMTILAGGANTILFPVSAPPATGATATAGTGNTLFVDSGATLDLNGNDQRIGGLSGLADNATDAAGKTFAGTAGTITNTSGTTANFRFSPAFPSFIATVFAGNLNIQRDGIEAIVFTSPSTYTGSTTLTGGSLTLQDGGGLLNTSALAIRRAVLRIDDTGLQTATHVNASATVGLDGGGIVFLSRSGGTQDVLNLGAMTLNTGASVIAQTLGGLANATTITGTSTINIASLTRSQGATINFTANANNNVQLGDNPRVVLGTGTPVLTNGIVGGWATTQGYNSAIPLSGNASFDFATYDPVTGFRPASYTAAFGAGNNVNVEPNSAGASVTTLAAGDTSANSLRIGGTGTTTSTTLAFAGSADVLNLQSGGLLSNGFNKPRFIGDSVNVGKLTAGGSASTGVSELFIHNGANVLTINTQIVNNPNGAQVALVLGGLSQSSTIQLNGSNTYTGTTYANGVNVNLNSPGLAIPGNLIISGGTANGGDSQSSAQQTVKLLASNQIAASANVTVNGGGLLDLNNSSNTINNLAFAAAGGGAGGIGPVVQTGATGALTIAGGITAANLFQATTIPVLSGNVTLPAGVHAVAIGTVAGAPGQVGLQINSVLTGGGSLDVTSGVLGLGHDVNKLSTAALNLSAGTTLTLTNVAGIPSTITPTIGKLTGSGNVKVNVTGTNQVLFVIGNDNGTGTFTGTITGPISISKVGTGSQTFTQSMTLNSLSIADGGEVVFGDGTNFAGLAPEPGFAPALVPEPGSIGLLMVGALGLLARRRRG